MTAILPAPTYVLARAAWIPTLVIWHADGRFTRLEGARGARGGAGRELAAAAGMSPAVYDVPSRHARAVRRVPMFRWDGRVSDTHGGACPPQDGRL